MLCLFDTPAGHALFRVKKPEKLSSPDDLHETFANPEKAGKMCASPSAPAHWAVRGALTVVSAMG